jgi:rhodanese-related sulfurtransferase
VLRILYDETQRQVFLVCDNGELITLPDCPECVRVQRIIDEPVADGALEEGNIVFSLAAGGQKRFPVGAAAQRRVSLEFTRRKLAEGGVLVDLRPEAVRKTEVSPEQDLLGKGIPLSIEHVDQWLGAQDKERPVIFVCRSGVQADTAARRALNSGFVYAYSLGGAAASFHV